MDKRIAIIKLKKNLLNVVDDLEKINVNLPFKNVRWLITSILSVFCSINKNERNFDLELADILTNEYMTYTFNNSLSEEEHEKISNLIYTLIRELFLHCYVYNDIVKANNIIINWIHYGDKAFITAVNQ